MLPFQLIVIISLLLLFLYVFRRRRPLVERFVIISIVILGVVLALAPNLSTDVARVLGVGRGSDLLMYLFILYSFLFQAHAALRWRANDRQVTELARALALATATRHACAGFEGSKEG